MMVTAASSGPEMCSPGPTFGKREGVSGPGVGSTEMAEQGLKACVGAGGEIVAVAVALAVGVAELQEESRRNNTMIDMVCLIQSLDEPSW
jgi:hypothetical protein